MLQRKLEILQRGLMHQGFGFVFTETNQNQGILFSLRRNIG